MSNMKQLSYPQALQDCLENKEDKSRIFPLFWVHGVSHDRLREELDAVYNCGLRAFCVESRPHPQFCEEQWWEDMHYILQYAKQRDMQVWLLDDKHFPTGYANAAIEKKYPHLRRKCVRVACVDVAGPVKGGCCLFPPMDADETVLSVCAFRRTGEAEEVDGNSGMLLSNIKNSLVFWDVPEGVWRVFFVIRTSRGPAHFKNYIDMCDAESCRVMVNEIYEPHYTHMGEYFGNTFRGFFSDEPCFANNIGSFVDTLGTPSLNVPWREDMPKLLAQECGISEERAMLLLPALWYTVTDNTAYIRLGYMDIVTRLYRDNFGNMLGAWCEEHGVEYIGHVVEDKGAHMRLGYGVGHFFRAQEGQHMAGMDIVLNQIAPGITDMCHTYSSVSGKIAPPDFYQLTAPKLATSIAHLDEKKQDRVMCELYGAFGWAEGVPAMKYLTDCLLSGGVNHFVPHAFSDKTEDPDCPPHFYNGGKNPQYPVFANLMDYTAKLAHILSNVKTCIDIAVFYNAEGEWCGGKCTDLQDVAAVLGRCQTDFDFVPMDMLLNAEVVNSRLQIGHCSYSTLVVPGSQFIPRKMGDKLVELEKHGVAVLYVGEKPTRDEAGTAIKLPGAEISLQEMRVHIKQHGWSSVQTENEEPDLRVLCGRNEQCVAYFFFNASLHKRINTYVELKNDAPVVAYDAWRNQIGAVQFCEGKHLLQLEPGEAVLWCSSDTIEPAAPNTDPWEVLPVRNVRVTMIEDQIELLSKQYSELPNQNFAEENPRFGGVIRYEFSVATTKTAKELKLHQVGETARLWINDIPCGAVAMTPFVFGIEHAWCEGENNLIIEVAVNQAYSRRDRFSTNAILPPMGLFGDIQIR